MKTKLISIVIFIITIGAISLMNTGCASSSNPATTQSVISAGDAVYGLLASGYAGAVVIADVEYSKKDISVNSWNQYVVPAFQSANNAIVSFDINYDDSANSGGTINASLQKGANAATLAIYPAIEQAISATIVGTGPGGVPPTTLPPLPAPQE